MRLIEARLQAVSSRNMYSEHGFEALIRPSSGQVCHSLIGGVELHARDRRKPRRRSRSCPTARSPAPSWPTRRSLRRIKLPVAAGVDRVEEVVGDPHRVVGVLARDGAISLRIPVGVEHREWIEVYPWRANSITRWMELSGTIARAPPASRAKGRIAAGSKQSSAVALAIDASLEDGVEPLGQAILEPATSAATFCSSLTFQLMKCLDVGMVDVDHDHLRRPARGAARFDRARRAVADLEEAHQAGGLAPAGERLVLAAQAARNWCRCRNRI